MRRLIFLLLLAGLGGGGWYFLKNFEIEGLDQLAVKPRDESAADEDPWARREVAVPPIARTENTIRIASFNIQVFGDGKADKPEIMQILADIVRRFDVVAIQEIRSKSPDLLPRFVDLINADGRHYDFVIGERQGRTNSKEQYAFVFDAQSLEVDRGAMYTVADPDDLLHRPPLVAPFRVRGPPENEAFTFTLINIHTDPDETDTELDALDDVFRAVRNDTRSEDDVILLGDLNVDDAHLGQLGRLPGIAWLISGVPTNTRGTKLYDNIILHRPSTTEFTGRAGVFDIMREYNLTMDEAVAVSDHLPIWAEFNIYESQSPGRVARGEATQSVR